MKILKEYETTILAVALIALGIGIAYKVGKGEIVTITILISYLGLIYPILKAKEKSSLDEKERKVRMITGKSNKSLESVINKELLNLKENTILDVKIVSPRRKKIVAYIIYY